MGFDTIPENRASLLRYGENAIRPVSLLCITTTRLPSLRLLLPAAAVLWWPVPLQLLYRSLAPLLRVDPIRSSQGFAANAGWANEDLGDGTRTRDGEG